MHNPMLFVVMNEKQQTLWMWMQMFNKRLIDLKT